MGDAIFADSILESSWAQRSTRSWTTLSSFGFQLLGIALLLMLPLLRTVGIPAARVVSTPIRAGRFERETPIVPTSPGHAPIANTFPNARLVAPGHVPTIIAANDDFASQPVGEVGDPGSTLIGMPGTDSGADSGISNILATGTHAIMPAKPPAPTLPQFRTSHMLEGNLIRRVEPVYPPLARTAHVQGSVILSAIISKDGMMERLRVISGHPLLIASAIDAVRQWRYRPYILNNEPIEVETQITVNFVLGN